MEQEGTASSRRAHGRAHIWRPRDAFVDHEIAKESQERVWSEFVRKAECVKTNRTFRPDPACDSYLAPYYKADEFDLTSNKQRAEYFESFKSRRLRTQSLYFLKLIQKEQQKIALLVGRYYNERDEDQKLCIQELIKRKKINVLYMESIRESMGEIICICEEGVAHFERCLGILGYK